MDKKNPPPPQFLNEATSVIWYHMESASPALAIMYMVLIRVNLAFGILTPVPGPSHDGDP